MSTKNTLILHIISIAIIEHAIVLQSKWNLSIVAYVFVMIVLSEVLYK